MFVVSSNGLGGPLYHKDQVPEHFHEKFIIKGYRHPKSTPFQCILSLFNATNETFNFWTHFLPSCYFMWVLKGLSEKLDFRNDNYTYPLLGYFCMCCLYPLASATAHTFNTMSGRARHICFFLDYSAISLSSLATCISYRAYAFPSELRFAWAGDIFVPIATINALLCIVISCETRFMPPSTFQKILRLGALGIPCVYATIPVSYRLFFGSEEEMHFLSWTPHFRSICLMFAAGFLYGTHFPERLYPGTFDIIGHSHQLFHICAILGTMEQMQGMLNDFQERRDILEEKWEFGSIASSIGIVGVVMVINTLVVCLFSYRLDKQKSKLL